MFLSSYIVIIFAPFFLLTVWWCYVHIKYKKNLKAFCAISQTLLIELIYKIRNTTDFYYIVLSSSKKFATKNYFITLGPYPILITWDPKIFSAILGSSKHINKSIVYKPMENVNGDTLLLTNGDTWRHQRKLLNPAFDYKNVLENINTFNSHSDNLIKLLEEEVNKESTDVSHLLETWMLELTHDTMLGGNVPVKDKIGFKKAIHCIGQITILRNLNVHKFFNITYMFTKDFWLERKMLKVVFDYTWNIIKKKQQEFAEGTNQRTKPILIDILMKQKESDKSITYDFIVKQLNLMIAAGFDPTASTVSFLLYNLAKFPKIQKKAYDEVYSILGDDSRIITHENIKEMKYLDLVIKESMRINTTVPIFSRELDEDVNVEGGTLPKGLTVGMLAYVMHLDPDVYPEPEEFIPERFLSENLNHNRYSYVPFAGGIRNCIGQRHAMLTMKVLLAKILLKYELVDVNHELCLAFEITLKSTTGIRIGIRNRNNVN